MKTILPGSAIGLFGAGASSRMFSLAACRMGYRVHVYSPEGDPAGSPAEVSIQAGYDDLDRIREFAAGVDVVTAATGDVPAISLQAASGSCLVRPSPKVFEAVENGIGETGESTEPAVAEFSMIGARAVDGAFAYYAPFAIDRVDGVLDISRSPASIDSRVAKRAAGLTRDVLEDLDLTGIACVEFQLTQGNDLLMREVTPHPHSSGYLTADACVTCQFEQQLRAICGLPLGSTELLRPAAMAILTDAVWQDGEPDWASAYALPGLKLYLYGQRKGHVTATASSATLAKQIVKAARASLKPHEA